MTQAHPLAWPDGWPRTPPSSRIDGRRHFGKMKDVQGHSSSRRAKKSLTFAEARDSLLAAVTRIGGVQLVLSTNFQISTTTGLPRADRRRPEDEGVAIYFRRKGVDMAFARDAYQRAEENMRSLALALEALAQLERHGGAGLAGRAFQGFTALPAPKRHHEILGIAEHASSQEIRDAHRTLIQKHHPDAGGDASLAAEINAAREAMLRARGLLS